jgi:hypothetical protein
MLLILLAAALTVAAADPPYAGKWKVNFAKSDFGETTVTYEQLPSGEMQATSDGLSYKFRLDGRDYSDPLGNTAAWKSINATTWQTTWKLNGKTVTTDTLTLSPDGKSLTVNTAGTKPNGAAINDIALYERAAGGPGLSGRWKTKNVKSSSPNVLELVPSGGDGLAYKVADVGLACDSKLDGKDYPCAGTTLSAGWTIALTKAGPRTFDMTVKQAGKLLYKESFTVSADGKTMTATGGATATSERVKAVYDRQ